MKPFAFCVYILTTKIAAHSLRPQRSCPRRESCQVHFSLVECGVNKGEGIVLPARSRAPLPGVDTLWADVKTDLKQPPFSPSSHWNPVTRDAPIRSVSYLRHPCPRSAWTAGSAVPLR